MTFEKQLKEKFNSLKECKNPKIFPRLVMDYVIFLGKEEKLSKGFEKLYKEGWLNKDLIYLLNYYYQFYWWFLSKKNEEYTPASFDTEFIDAQTGVREKIDKKMVLIDSENKNNRGVRQDFYLHSDTETIPRTINLLNKVHQNIIGWSKKKEGDSIEFKEPELKISQKSINYGAKEYRPYKGSNQEKVLNVLTGKNKSKRTSGKYCYSLELNWVKNMILDETGEELTIEDIKKAIISMRRSLKNNGIPNLRLPIRGDKVSIMQN